MARIAAVPAAAAARLRELVVVVVPRGLQASVVAPAEPVLVAVRGEAEAAQGAEVVAVEVVEVADEIRTFLVSGFRFLVSWGLHDSLYTNLAMEE